MTYSLILLQDRFVALAVFVQTMVVTVSIEESITSHLPCRITLTTLVEEELGLIEVFSVASGNVKLCQAHLSNLVPRHHTSLTGLITHFSTYTIRILDGNVEEILLACSIIMSHSSFAEMTEIVELMGEVFHPFPALGASPVVRVLRVLCTGGV